MASVVPARRDLESYRLRRPLARHAGRGAHRSSGAPASCRSRWAARAPRQPLVRTANPCRYEPCSLERAMSTRHALSAIPLFATTLLTGSSAHAGPPPAPNASFESTAGWTSADPLSVGAASFGDANHDGLPDLAVALYDGSSVVPATQVFTRVYRNLGKTLETAPSWSSTSDVGRWATNCGWALLSNPKEPDLIVVAGGSGADPSYIYANGTSGLGTSAAWTSAQPSVSGLGLAVGDVNSDGTPDVFVANQCYSPAPGVTCNAPNFGYVSA